MTLLWKLSLKFVYQMESLQMIRLVSLFLIFGLVVTSCVTRVDIPNEEESKIFIECDMLRGERIIADLSTSNNLNNLYPITNPQDAKISIYKSIRPGEYSEYIIDLVYDEELGKYASLPSENTSQFLSEGVNYKMEARIYDSPIEEVVAFTDVPFSSQISEYELLDEYIDGDFWIGTIGFTVDLPSRAYNDELYYHIIFENQFTTLNASEEYTFSGEKKELQIVDIKEGAGGLFDLMHKDGYFIQYKDLEKGYFEITLQSSIPLSEQDQVMDHVFVSLYGISEEYFEYHKARSNLISAQGSIFEEPVVMRSNVKNGHGLFSACVLKNQTLELR